MERSLTQIELSEQREQNILFFQSKSNILTMRMDDYLKANKCAVSITPNNFINEINGTPKPVRPLYVFDFIGIALTNGVIPDGMTQDMYDRFLFSVEEALIKSGLSTRMQMDERQRQVFDFLVREKVQNEKGIPKFLTNDEWYRVIRRIIYRGIPQQIEQILNKRNYAIVLELTEYVRTKCSNVLLSDEIIMQFLNEALEINNITMRDLRYFDFRAYIRQRKK